MTVTGTPIPPSERLVTLDVLRGCALFGILVVNWTLDWQPDSEPWAVTGTANVVTSWFVWLVASSKFWNIFSFLFAAGFVLQIDRLRSRDAKVVSIYSRRYSGDSEPEIPFGMRKPPESGGIGLLQHEVDVERGIDAIGRYMRHGV